MSTYAEYLNADHDDDVSVVVTVQVDNLVGHTRGDQFDYVGPRRTVRKWERAGAVAVKGKPKRRKKGSK